MDHPTPPLAKLAVLEELLAAAENMLLHHGSRMPEADRTSRTAVIVKAAAALTDLRVAGVKIAALESQINGTAPSYDDARVPTGTDYNDLHAIACDALLR